jgi:molybdate transport system regulatory protein
VTAVSTGGVMATVRGRLPGGRPVTAAVTLDAVRELCVSDGSRVTVLAKATEIALATGEVSGLGIRNQFPGTVSRLGLTDGTRVTALLKCTEVSPGAA